MPLSASTGFVDTLRFGAQLIVAQLTVYEYSVAGIVTATYSLPVSAAQITTDRNSAIRTSGSITLQLVPSIPPPPLLPTGLPMPGSPQPLTPFGNEVAISLGLALNPAATPVAQVTGSIAAGATQFEVADLTGNGLQFGPGDTICFIGSACAPAQVTAVNHVATNSYLVTLLSPGLTALLQAGTAVAANEFVSLGLFTVTTTTVDATAPNLTVTLNVSDRSFVIGARKLTNPYAFPATASGTFEDEVMALLNQVWGTYPGLPALIYNFSDCNNPVVPPATYNQGSDPWQMVLDLATVAGNELYIDPNGIVTGHRYPDVTSAPVVWWFTSDSSNIFASSSHTIAAGSPYQVPIGVQVQFTRESIYNDVYVTGSGSYNAPTTTSLATQSSAQPVIGHAADTNPSSATYVSGPLGDLPEFISSNLVPTASQGTDMANLDLSMSISSSWQITVTAQPNPLFYVDDVVAVNHPEIGLNGPVATTQATPVILEGSFAKGSPGVQVISTPFPLAVGDAIMIGTAATPVTITAATLVGVDSWQLSITPPLPSDQVASAPVSIVTGYLGVCMVVDTVTTGVRYADITTVTGRVIPGRYA